MDTSEHDDDDDGLRGPVGERFAAALFEVGRRLGVSVSYPTLVDPWVNEACRNRELLVRWSTMGAQARTTGYRWIAVRISAGPLGVWANPPSRHDAERIQGVRLPLTPLPPSTQGTWADDPILSADLFRFASRVMPPGADAEVATLERWLKLHVRNDGVVWHLRATRLDATLLAESIELLYRVASYAETHDAALSARLGEAAGVTRHRNLELFLMVGAAALFGSMMLGILLFLIAC